jgi:hypothetical protein
MPCQIVELRKDVLNRVKFDFDSNLIQVARFSLHLVSVRKPFSVSKFLAEGLNHT